MGFSKEDFERVLDAVISNKKFYRRLLEHGLDINEVFYKILARPQGGISLDAFYRDNHGIENLTVIRWQEKYNPEKFEDVHGTIEALSSACQSSILTEREKYEIQMIKERVCKKYEIYRDEDVRRKYMEAKEKSLKTQAQRDTEVLSPLFNDIWKITERINGKSLLDAEGQAEDYYKKDVIELLACLLQAHGLAQMWALCMSVNKNRDVAFKKALKMWKNMPRKREPGSNPPYDVKYVHDRVYPP